MKVLNRKITTLLILQQIWCRVVAVKWLSIATVAMVDHIKKEDECEGLIGLVRRQKQICRKNIELMDAVKGGAIEAIQECQSQFRSRRWNCSTIDKQSVFGKLMTIATREVAFIHAISAAGVSHAVTTSCSTGQLRQCGCDSTVSLQEGGSTLLPPDSEFQWSGCSDNVAYGTAFSRAFVDSRERVKAKGGDRALMNLHNNNSGRKLLESLVKTQCKCHGVSGSCELKTCWRTLPSFSEVGSALRDRFDAAVEVEARQIGTRRELATRQPFHRPHTETDLVHLSASPDFCEYDENTGSLGTQGRTCNKTSDGMDGCKLMCCGRGYDTRRSVLTERCHCKFHWCCYVKCQKCRTEVDEHVCR